MKNKVFLIIYLLVLSIFISCGGGGGGGGAVAFQSTPGLHNGGDAGGYGQGNHTGNGFGGDGNLSSGSSDLLFETIPSFFSPIDHIDISLVINGSPAEFPGLTISAKKDVLGLSNGDKVSGTAVITLSDGSTRDATLSLITIGIDNKLSFAVTYKYILQDDAGTATDVEGTYTTASGIDVSGITWTRTSGALTDNIECWRSDSGTSYAAGGVISGISGDVVLTALYPALYTYTLIDGSGHASNITGTYTFASGIDVSAASSWTSDGTSSGSAISGWKSDTGTVYTPNASGKITGITGDITLTARYPLAHSMLEGTLHRYGTGSTYLNTSLNISVSGGTAPYSAVATSPAVDVNVSGTGVGISINPTYGSAIGETVTGTATALGAQITITISDSAGAATDVPIRLVDCIENTSTGIKLNTANTTAAAITTLDIPANGIVNGASIGDSIPGDAFRNSSGLGNVTLPSTITTIAAGTMSGTHPYANAQGAFSGSTITGLTASGLRTIGNGAFTNSSISTINLSNVRTIGRYAFTGCTGLSSVNLSSVTTLSGSAFAGCSALSSVTWWGSTGPSTISERAFDGTALTSSSFASFPSIVTTIDSKAFANTGITDLSWLCDTNVNTIASDAFDGCTLSTMLTVPDTVTDITSVMPKFKELGITEVSFNGSTTVGANTFKDFTALETITITGSELVTYALPGGPDASRSKWGSNIFTNCSSLQTIDCTSCSEVHYTGGVLPNSGAFASSGVVKLGTSLSRLVLGACSVQPGMHFEYAGSSTELLPGGSVNTERYGGASSSTNNGNVKVHCLSDDVWLAFSDTTISWSVTTAP